MTRLKQSALWLALLFTVLIPLTAQAASDDFSWTGLVQVVGGQGGVWKIGGLSAQANSGTLIDAGLAAGNCAEVEYHVNSSSVNIASVIKRQDAYRCGSGTGSPAAASKVYAILKSFPGGLIGSWVIGSVTYTANNSTQFKETDGSFRVGRCVGVEYTAAKVALELETEPAYKCTNTGAGLTPGVVYSRVNRILVSFPANLVGAWTVVDTTTPTYNTTSATRFEQERGPFFGGACVEIKFQPGTINAVEISTTGADDCSSSGGEEPESKLYGLIGTIPGGNIGVWTIGGFSITSDANTKLKQDHGNFAQGVCVEVEYLPQSGNLAKKIATEEAYHCGNGTDTNKVYGIATTVPTGLYGAWLIGGSSYNADGSTQFKGTFTNGVCVQVEYYAQAGVFHATEIEREDSSRCSATPALPGDSKLYATITSFPASPFTGGWNIGGITFQAGGAAQFEQDDGSFANGACVKANYTVTGGVRNLSHVETELAYKCSPQFSSYGSIEVLPAGFPATLSGNWQISGITYNAGVATQFKQEHGFFSIGSYVEVKFASPGNVVSIETHVAPTAGLRTLSGHLDTRPSDDWSDWVVNGTSYKADHSIEIDASSNSAFSAAGVGPLADPVQGQSVILNTYRLNGETYITSASLLQSAYLPILRK